MRADQPGQRPCNANRSRRNFGRAMVGASTIALLGSGTVTASSGGESGSLFDQFARSLSDEQRRAILFPFADPKRLMIQNHWAVVPATIASLTLPQQDLALQLIRQVCTPDGFARLTRQRSDDAEGWKHDHLALFIDPAQPGRSEWVLTGRHLTLRGSAQGTITSGPLFWGHTAPEPANIWQDQARQAGALFRSLDPEQRSQASVARGPGGSTDAGLQLAELRSEQRALVRHLLVSLTNPFRAFEVSSISSYLAEGSQLTAVRWQVFRTDGDGAPDSPRIWRLIGPGFSWSFHGEPHVHSWFDSV